MVEYPLILPCRFYNRAIEGDGLTQGISRGFVTFRARGGEKLPKGEQLFVDVEWPAQEGMILNIAAEIMRGEPNTGKILRWQFLRADQR